MAAQVILRNYSKQLLPNNTFATGILRYDESVESFDVPILYKKREYE